MPAKRLSFTITALLLAALLTFGTALAANIVIDGLFGDWASAALLVDDGGPDDETSPARADVTEFGADSNSSGLFLLMAWDDTSFTGGQSITAGAKIRTGSGNYFLVSAVADGNPGAVAASSLNIQACSDSTCSSLTNVCSGLGCTGASLGSGTGWVDPFSGYPSHTASMCSGTNCITNDTAVEIYLPWSLVGGAPASGQYLFLTYGSYPSGTAQAPKDTNGANGLACRNDNGTYTCYPSTPTALVMTSFRAAPGGPASTVLPLAGALLLGAGGLRLGLLRRRA